MVSGQQIVTSSWQDGIYFIWSTEKTLKCYSFKKKFVLVMLLKILTMSNTKEYVLSSSYKCYKKYNQ